MTTHLTMTSLCRRGVFIVSIGQLNPRGPFLCLVHSGYGEKIDESCISGASDPSPGAWQADIVLQIGSSPALSCAVVVVVVNDSGLVAWPREGGPNVRSARRPSPSADGMPLAPFCQALPVREGHTCKYAGDHQGWLSR